MSLETAGSCDRHRRVEVPKYMEVIREILNICKTADRTTLYILLTIKHSRIVKGFDNLNPGNKCPTAPRSPVRALTTYEKEIPHDLASAHRLLLFLRGIKFSPIPHDGIEREMVGVVEEGSREAIQG